MAMHPDMPRSVAEYNLRRDSAATAAAQSPPRIDARYAGATSIEDLEARSPVEFMSSYLAGQASLWRRQGRPDHSPAVVIGGVPEGNWVSVLYRYAYEFEESDVTGEIELYRPPPKQLRLRLSPDGWRIGFAGPTLGQTIGDLGPGVLPRMGELICPPG